MNASQDSSAYSYQVGGSLKANAPTYIRRQADQKLYDALAASQFCYVFNARQVGKSSLRVQTMAKLREQGVCCIAIDITRIGSEHLSPEQWYRRIVSELWRGANLPGQVNLKAWLKDNPELSGVQLLDRFLDEVLLAAISNQNIVIFVDEIDSIISLDFPINDFFALIRACYNQRVDQSQYERLTFCLLGVATPSDLMTDKTRTPFNIGQAIALTGFTPQEAQSLSTGLNCSHPALVLERILHWTGGQPFLTQKLCQLITAQNWGDRCTDAKQETIWVDQLVQNQIIRHWESQDEPEHLRTIRDRILRNEQQASQRLSLYQAILQQGSLAASDQAGEMELRLSGLVVKQQGRLKPYNAIYAAIFNQAWVTETLEELRPYGAALAAWLASAQQDESRLLRGQALEEALAWSAGRAIGQQDVEFVRLSQQNESQTVRQSNTILMQANKKAKRRLKLGAGIFGTAIVLASGIGLWAQRTVREASTAIQDAELAKQSLALEQQSKTALETFEKEQTQGLLIAMRAANELLNLKIEDGNYLTATPQKALQLILDKIREQPLAHREELLNRSKYSSERTQVQNLDQDSFLTTYIDGKTILRDIKGNVIGRLKGRFSDVTPDGEYLFTISEDCHTYIWNKKGEKISRIKSDGAIHTVKVSPTSSHFSIQTVSRGVVRKSCQTWNDIYPPRSDIKEKWEIWKIGKFDKPIFTRASSGLKTFKFIEDSLFFSPNGKQILIRNLKEEETVWDLQGNPVSHQAFHLPQETQNSIVLPIISPNQKYKVESDRIGKQAIQVSANTPDIKDSQKLEIDLNTTLTIEFNDQSNRLLLYPKLPNKTHVQSLDTENRPYLWKLFDNYLYQTEYSDSSLKGFQFNASGSHIAFINLDGQLMLWRLDNNEKIKLEAPDPSRVFHHVAFSPSGTSILASDSGKIDNRYGKLQRWNLSGNHVKEIDINGGWDHFWGLRYVETLPSIYSDSFYYKITQLGEGGWHYQWQDIFSADGNHTIAFNYAKSEGVEENGKYIAKLHHLETQQAVVLSPIPGRISKFNPVKSVFLSTTRSSDSRFIDDEIILRDFSGNHLAHFKSGKLRNAYFSADGKSIITIPIMPRGAIKIWDLQGNLIRKTHLKVTSSKTGDSLANYPNNFISNTTEKVFYKFVEKDVTIATPGINQTIFNSKGQYFIATDDEYQSITLWDMEGNISSHIDGQPGWFMDIQTSPDGKRIATLGNDRKIRIWNRDAQQIGEYNGDAMTFNEDWSRIAIASFEDSTITVWPMDDLEGLLKRSCDWLSIYMRSGPASKTDKRICEAYL